MKAQFYYLKTRYIGTLLIVAALFFSACNDSKKKGEDTNDSTATDSVGLYKEVIAPTTASAAEIAARLQATGADFLPDIVNSSDSLANYFNDPMTLKAANLGVYVLDIYYLTSYEKRDEALRTFTAALELANDVGLVKSLADLMNEKYGDYIQNDSVKQLLDSLVANASNEVIQGDEALLTASVTAGSYVESLYIRTNMVENYPKDILPDDQRLTVIAPLLKGIVTEKQSLEKLIEYMNDLVGDGGPGPFLQKLNELDAAFDELQIEEKIANNPGNMIVSEDMIDGISEKVNELRQMIIAFN